MARLAQLTARAGRQAVPTVTAAKGEAGALLSLAKETGDLANQFGVLADQATAREGKRAGTEHAEKANLPGEIGAPSTVAANSAGSAHIKAAASDLGIDPLDLATAISYETAGKFSPSIRGGKNNEHIGLIQFGANEQKRFGVSPDQPFGAQMRSVVSFLKARGLKPGSSLLDIYSTINAGSPGRYDASDRPGFTVRRHVELMRGDARTKAASFLGIAFPSGNKGRPEIKNPDGSISTERTITIDIKGKFSNIPTIVNGKPVEEKEAISLHRQGKNKAVGGSFKTLNEAVAAAQTRSNQIGVARAINKPDEASEPFTLMSDATIRGRAFNRSARGAFDDRLKLEMIAATEEIAKQNAGNPAGLKTALDAYQAGVSSQLGDPQLRQSFQQDIGRQRLALERSADREAERNDRDKRRAGFIESYQSQRTNLVRLARRVGVNDEGDNAIAGEMAALERHIGASNLSDPQKAKLRVALTQDIAGARVLAGFDRQSSPAARTSYAKAFRDDWLKDKGKGSKLTPESFDALDAQMARTIARDETASRRDARALDGSIDGAMKMVRQGFAIEPQQVAALKARVEATGDPVLAQSFRFFEAVSNWQTRAIAGTPEQIVPQIAVLESDIRKNGATPQKVEFLKTMRQVHDRMEKGLKTDPLKFAQSAGRITITPLDFTSPETIEKSLAARQSEARAVADTYGRPVKFFMAGEAALIQRRIAEKPERLLGFAINIRRAFGDGDVPKALAEISKDAPVIAHAAGVAIATDSTDILTTTTEALKLRAVEGYVPIKIKTNERQAATRSEFGPSMLALPSLEAAATKQAELIFEVAARNAGLDPEDDPEGAATLWRQSLSEALGRRVDGDREIGGLGSVNGHQTLLPPNMTEDEVQDMLDGLTQDDLAFLPQIKSANGVPITADQIGDARLVAVGQGRYRVALGDPGGGDPKYIFDAKGDFFILDLNDLNNKRALDGDHDIFNRIDPVNPATPPAAPSPFGGFDRFLPR